MRKIKGFTLVELLVVVVIIGILAAIALPNFIGAQKKAKAAAIKGNMRTIQIASESYATDQGGAYAANATGAFLNYLPGGSSTATAGTAGNIPQNPVTGAAGVIAAGGPGTTAAIQALRAAAVAAGVAGAGDTSYCQADAGNSYAVTGSDADGNYVGGVGGKTLVLSNQ
ncbi:MAG: prepilin-type N-terminal cleavage/methylation domain-containing protein [Candidatus Obscuribacterales bacterium]|nr:prepilin-type N-terminal cleavage/methylation domain-containing protein [Candidatus Obscuribacterales bacterium]MBX9720142.1 prepilin-type N-terminal cleavage/methylation domain-containing protein [Candidatus Obscuribacterales bacterium]